MRVKKNLGRPTKSTGKAISTEGGVQDLDRQPHGVVVLKYKEQRMLRLPRGGRHHKKKSNKSSIQALGEIQGMVFLAAVSQLLLVTIGLPRKKGK